MKKIIILLSGVLLLFSMNTTVFAEDTTDYSFKTTEVVDFCVYNTWGTMSVDCDKFNVESIAMTVEVTDFIGDPIKVKLYNRESVTWQTWASDAQVIDGDGTYTFYLNLAENAYPSENLCTIYLKDVECALPDEDSEGQSVEASNISCHMVMSSCEFNTEQVVEAESTEAVTNTADTVDESTSQDDSAQSDFSEETESSPFPFLFAVAGGVVITGAVVLIIVRIRKK